MTLTILSRAWLDFAERRVKSASSLRDSVIIAARLMMDQLDPMVNAATCEGLKTDYCAFIRQCSETADENCAALWGLTSDVLNLFDRHHELDDTSFADAVASCVEPLKEGSSDDSPSTRKLWECLLVSCIAFVQGWAIGFHGQPGQDN